MMYVYALMRGVSININRMEFWDPMQHVANSTGSYY